VILIVVDMVSRLKRGVTREPANSRKCLDALYDGVSRHVAVEGRQSGVVVVLGLKDGGGVVYCV